jgi:hypothetical protein
LGSRNDRIMWRTLAFGESWLSAIYHTVASVWLESMLSDPFSSTLSEFRS